MELDGLSSAQQDALKKFGEAVRDVRREDDSDYNLIKWLRARSFDVKKADDMYRKSMKWREDYGADRLLLDYKEPEVMAKYYPGGFCGQDRQGRPIWIDPLGMVDMKGIMFSLKKSEILKGVVYRIEKTQKTFQHMSREKGRNIDQCCHIIDMSGFGKNLMWKPALDLYIEIVKTLEDNYPETQWRTYIINASKIFQIGFNVLKKFIDEGTAAKFVMCGGNWKETLNEALDLDQLPVYYGGGQKDETGDEKCQQWICYGGEVPKEFYRRKEEFFALLEGDICTQTVGRRGRVTLAYDIADSQHVIRYAFTTESGDLIFEVHRTGSDPDADPKAKEQVEPATKLDCHRVPEDGLVWCDKPGTYVLVFRNPSLMSTRALTYCVQVLQSTDSKILTEVSEKTRARIDVTAESN